MASISITKAIYVSGYKIELTFSDDTVGVVDLTNHLKGPDLEPLKNLSYFKNYKLNAWTIEWQNGADFSPKFLYDLVKNK